VTYFAPEFRLPQAIKYDAGVRRTFGGGFGSSIDAMYVISRNSPYVTDANLNVTGVSAEGRVMYGTFVGARRTPTISRRDSTYAAVYRFDNRSADRYLSLTTELHREWTNGALLQAGYAWSRTQDLTSFSNFNGMQILRNNPVQGSLENRQLARSARDIPHNLTLVAVGPGTWRIIPSAFLRVRSGAPYAYVSGQDTNLDGVPGNDLFYVPRDSADAKLVNPELFGALNAYIDSEPCLRAQRGRIMERNSCRNPAVTSLDARLVTRGIAALRNVEINADVFNLPNLLRRDWGLTRETPLLSVRETVPLVSGASFDATSQRPISRVGNLPAREHIVPEPSRWRIQLGLRLNF
jgi:hypothetical protein